MKHKISNVWGNKDTEKEFLEHIKAEIRCLDDNNKVKIYKWILKYWGGEQNEQVK